MILSTSCCILFLAAALPAFPQDTRYSPKSQLIPAPECLTLEAAWQGGYTPCDSASHETWLKDIHHWRFERRIRLSYNGWRYDQPAGRWLRKSFIQPQM